jgi:hypothetical protein
MLLQSCINYVAKAMGTWFFHDTLVMLQTIAYILVQKLCIPGVVTSRQSSGRCLRKCKINLGLVSIELSNMRAPLAT